MLTGRRYRLKFTPEQEAFAHRIAGICRSVWNTALEQRRDYRRRGSFIGYAEQCAQLAQAKREFVWLAEAPAQVLQQTLKDLDRAVRTHGPARVHWRSARQRRPSFRFPTPGQMVVERLARKWGRVKLPKFGWVLFRWSRPMGGMLRSATVRFDGRRWFVAFLVEDGQNTPAVHPGPAVGLDRGVKVAVTTSDGDFHDRLFVTPREADRHRRLQQQLARSTRGSKRRRAVIAKLGAVMRRVRNRRTDFNAKTARSLAVRYGTIVLEDLRIRNMTASATGQNVRQKAGLNRAILDKSWHGFERALANAARSTGSTMVKVAAPYTSQRCSACGQVDARSRESQARFACTSCGVVAHADVNAAINIANAAGHVVSGRGDLGITRSAKRQPPRSRGIPAQQGREEVKIC